MSVIGILPVVPTPFRDGQFDPASFQRLLDHMHDAVDGFVLLGSTGEAPSLDIARRKQIADAVLAMTDRRLRVVVGVSSTCLSDTVALARHAQAAGAGAVLCAAPFYFQNSDEGVLRYLAALDAALDIDLVFYDNPAATKTIVSASTVIAWSRELEHLRTVKLTDHDLSKVDAWQAAGLKVLAGDDPIAFRYLAAGVDGAMMIAPAVFPDTFREVWDLCTRSAFDEALELFGQEIAPFSHVFGIGDEIATTKSLFASLGIFSSDEVLVPLVTTSPARQALLRTAYDSGQRHAHARQAATA